MTSYSNNKTKELVRISLFSAIIILQSWVPFLGNITIPLYPLAITFIHVTVIVATLYLGTKAGVIVGGVWGVNSLIRAFVLPTSPMYLYVFNSPFVAILPRILMPLIIGLISHQVLKKLTTLRMNAVISGVLGSLLNTVLVLGSIVIFRRNEYLSIQDASMDTLWNILGGIVLANGVPEMILAGILTPIILIALVKAPRDQKK